MINSLEDNRSYADQQQSQEGVEEAVIANDFKITSTTGNEIFSSDVSHVSTDTRVTFKRVSYTSRSIKTGKKISLMHSSTVTTTRSWSSPSEVSLLSDLDRHAVSGLDLLNQIPSSGDLFGWVNNLDAFIKEQNVGLNEDQVRTDGTCAADTNCGDDVTVVEEALNNKSDKEEDENTSTGNSASRSELFTIRHFASFSQMGSTK
jgi:hypothetical protein